MEWASKLAPWDLVESGQSSNTSMLSFDGTTSLGAQDCSVDLKLGGLGGQWRGLARAAAPAGAQRPPPPPPAPAPGKRARAPGSTGQAMAACLVDGCKSDLSHCREYHRRHKVCEAHSKTPVVVVGGVEQRFCQQCSRFHLLAEFDEVKRSCRKRLDGHNRRRRKPHQDPMNPRSMFPNHQVSQFSTYPPVFPAAIHGPNWHGIGNSELDAIHAHHPSLHFLDRQPPFSISFSGTFKAPKRFPFLQDGDGISGTSQPSLLRPISCTEIASIVSSSSSSRTATTRVPDPMCALSLLSSSRNPAASVINAGPAQPYDGVRMQYTALAQHGALHDASVFAAGDHSADELVPDVMFQAGDEEPSQAMPFSWQC